ncbi:MAG: 16S rRNA (uracil(1498)-N(3))-methyltransferase [Epsilonproteobacteria bacterium]|nr:16S rRNA (uracil(1498)-N(3))-methyltransferase [Campylobacterota bacterium]
MQFIFSKNSGENSLNLNTKEFAHIFKVRRVKNGETLFFRNLRDDMLYKYKLISIDKKEAILELLERQEIKIEAKNHLHVGWCVVDPKIIEKTLPFLNELGVAKISFVYCQFSQKNFKIDTQRMKRILINSNQQCGRSSLMKIEILQNLKEFLILYPDCKIIDFSKNKIKRSANFTSFLVGCEGGFSKDEKKLMDEKNILGIDNKMILRSETAVLYACILNS